MLRPRSRVEAALAALVFCSTVYFFDLDGGPNAHARLDQAHAVVAGRTLAIDPFVVLPRKPVPPVGWTIDWSTGRDGHYYPAKAPGLSLLTVPPYAALYRVERALGLDPLDVRLYRLNRIVLTAAINGTLAAIGLIALLRLLLLLGYSLATATAATLAVGAGTAYLPYASMFYSHTPTAALIALAGYWSARGARETGGHAQRSAALAGAALGAAVLTDYGAAFAVVALGLYWVGRASVRAASAFALGGLPFLAAFAAYHGRCFGGWLRTAYASQNPLFGAPVFQAPTFSRFVSLLFGPYRGLLVFSPTLLLAIPGLWRSARRRELLAETAVGLGVALAYLVLNASFRVWWGGATTGPRYLIPAMPLLGVLIAAGIEEAPRAAFAAVGLSIMNQAGALAAGLMCRESAASPLIDVVYPQLLGWQPLGRPNLARLVLPADGPLSLLPIVVVWAALGVWMARAARSSRKGATPDRPAS